MSGAHEPGKNGDADLKPFSQLYLIRRPDGHVSLSEAQDGGELLAEFEAGLAGVVIKPESSVTPLFCNGKSLQADTVLDNGDRLRAGELIVTFARDGRGGVLFAQTGDENATLPPGEEAPEAVPWRLAADDAATAKQSVREDAMAEIASERIDPGQYSRSESTVVAKRVLKPVPLAVAGAFLLLAIFGWFLFTARAVQIIIEPSPDAIDVDGGLMSFEMGGRYMLRPGESTVSAEKEGYYLLTEQFEVSHASNQEFRFELIRLPDVYRIASAPVQNAQVLLDGAEVGATPLGGLEIHPGEHVLQVSAERYLDQQIELSVDGGGDELTLDVELKPAWAEIDIRSEPPGATVHVDDVEIGTTPLQSELLQGTRQLVLRRPGFKNWVEEYDVVAGVADVLEAKLVPSDGLASIRSRPPGASVTINGQYRGRTPISVRLAPRDNYTVTFSLAGYASQARSLSVSADQDASLTATLEPVLGTVYIASDPPGADVTIDGERRGQTNMRLELSAREHLVEFSKPGYAPYHAPVTPRPGFEQQLIASLKTLEQARWESIPVIIKTSAGQDLKLIRKGEVNMGAPRRQAGRRSNEIEHHAQLSRPFYLGLREVSNAEFRQFDAEHNSGAVKSDSLNQNTHPVVEISWQRAAQYCNWLSAKDGLPAAYVGEDGKLVAVSPLNTGYRLPTEAEWAYAERYASGGMRQVYPWGDNLPPPDGAGNFADRSAANVVKEIIGDYNDGYAVTSPTGKFNASDLGFFDLAGNAAEWVHDYYSVDPSQSGTTATDPAGPSKGEYHVIRGSSWATGGVTGLRVSFRDYGADARNDVGFRIARYLE